MITTTAASLVGLVGGEFFTLYFETASIVARTFSLVFHIDPSKLELAHEQWKDEADRLLRTGHMPSSAEETWAQMLSIMAVHLCEANCISYSEQRETANNNVSSEYRRLVIDYPTEFTGLQFVRNLHLEVYFSLNGAAATGRLPELRVISAGDLQKMLGAIRESPDTARSYVTVLGLPILSAAS